MNTEFTDVDEIETGLRKAFSRFVEARRAGNEKGVEEARAEWYALRRRMYEHILDKDESRPLEERRAGETSGVAGA